MSENAPPTLTISVPANLRGSEWIFKAPHPRLTCREFEIFCAENCDLRLEMTAEGEIIVMDLVGAMDSHRNFALTGSFGAWSKADGSGVGFSSSAGFALPNGAVRSPDLSWVRKERWDALTREEKDSFSPLCPDFVVELRPLHDRLAPIQEKMEEYIANGAELGWLIDPKEKKVHIYRPGASAEILDQPKEISGEPLLKGFTLKLEGIIN